MHDADSRRNELESLESLLSPLKELVALAITLELHVQIEFQRPRRTEEIDLHRVIDNQINRHERLDDLRVASEPLHSTAHRGEVDNQRNSGEVLQNNARNDEWDLRVRGGFRVPFCKRFNIFASDLFPVAVAQHRFEHNPDAYWQPRNFADLLFFQGRQRIEPAF